MLIILFNTFIVLIFKIFKKTTPSLFQKHLSETGVIN